MFRSTLIAGLIATSLLFATTRRTAAAVERPLKQKGTVVVTELGMELDGQGRLLIPWEVTGDGHSTHLGRYSVAASGLVVVDLATGEMSNESSGTLFAANGDTLRFEGDFIDASTVLLHFVSGTGRFEGAEGTATQSLLLVSREGATSVYEFEIVGKLCY